MRRKQSFLLTILTSDGEKSSFCGQLKVISNGRTCTFSTIDEFQHLIMNEIDLTEGHIQTQVFQPVHDKEQQVPQADARESGKTLK
jgi:hypothetical protein